MGKTLKLDQVGLEIEKRLDKFIDGYVTGLQEQLAKAAPYETGRLASSWRIGQGSPNRDVEPEREMPRQRDDHRVPGPDHLWAELLRQLEYPLRRAPVS